MPDWNPDREGHVDHKWIVHKAIPKHSFKGVVAGGKNMLFNDEGRFTISDAAVAAEIRQVHPRDVTVSRVRWDKPADRGHNYHFVCPAMPWHKEDKDGDSVS